MNRLHPLLTAFTEFAIQRIRYTIFISNLHIPFVVTICAEVSWGLEENYI